MHSTAPAMIHGNIDLLAACSTCTHVRAQNPRLGLLNIPTPNEAVTAVNGIVHSARPAPRMASNALGSPYILANENT